MNLTDNTILITGGTSGIGRALAEVFYQRGNQVIIAGRRQHLLDDITAAHSGIHGIQLDVQDSADIEAFASHIREQFPKLNVLINNAGIGKTEDLTLNPINFSVMQSTIQTNVVGVLHLTAALSRLSNSNRIQRSSPPPLAWLSFPQVYSQPIVRARLFCTPGCSRSAFSFEKPPWRFLNLPHPMYRRSLAGLVRRLIPPQCHSLTLLLK